MGLHATWLCFQGGAELNRRGFGEFRYDVLLLGFVIGLLLAGMMVSTALAQRTPPPKQGADRIIAGRDAALIDQATGVVVDIPGDVVTR